ncbi:MAG TPA: Mur ligase family protein [Thermomicrobiales bacterium]|nr:Mur ligase family protein [Thermomicrobiales bacterium]
MTDTTTRPPGFRSPIPGRGQAETLPVISIAGTSGKTTIAWMLNSIFEQAGWPSAAWLSSGVYVEGELQEGELGPWSRVLLAARHGELRVVVQEMIAETVIAAGLPKDTYPLGIITTLCGNNEACLLSEDASRERRAMNIVVESMRPDGMLIINADDYDVNEVASSASCLVLPYALHNDNPVLQARLAAGGIGCWLQDGQVVVGDRHEFAQVVDVAAVPATLGGTMLFQVQNLLAATAAAVAIGIDPFIIEAAMLAFGTEPDLQPGAANVLSYNDATIIVDSPELVTTLRQLARGIRHVPHRRSLVVCGSLPRLSAEEIHEAGRVIGGIGGIVLLHGDQGDERRMAALKAGIAAATVPPIVINVPDEEMAVDQLLNTIGTDDLGLVLVDEADVALSHLWPAPTINISSRRRRDAK